MIFLGRIPSPKPCKTGKLVPALVLACLPALLSGPATFAQTRQDNHYKYNSAPPKPQAQKSANANNLERDQSAFNGLARVDLLMKSGKMVDARLLLIDLCRLDPNSYSAEIHGLLAESCYFLGNYKEAVKDYQLAIKFGGKDWRLFWNSALSNMHLGNYQTAIEQAKLAMKQELPAASRLQAERFIKEMQEKIARSEKQQQGQAGTTASSGDSGSRADYLDLLMSTQEANLWALEKMPLKVFLATSNDLAGRPLPLFRPAYQNTVIDALNLWSKASGGKLSFILVQDPTQADLHISFSQTPADVAQVKGEAPVEQGITRFYLENARGDQFRKILRAQVQLLLLRPTSGKPLSPDEVKEIALHELGHALGLRGHSDNSSDIMYFNQSFRQLPALTKRDKATMARLYATYPSLEESGVLGFNYQPLNDPSQFNQGQLRQSQYRQGFPAPPQ
ncbi:MAG: matrixin family metalloprotease [Candidatus Obscuribacter sp.]|nr:matrixin family metalloprotease [Candidatus Obscuribacter sp.]